MSERPLSEAPHTESDAGTEAPDHPAALGAPGAVTRPANPTKPARSLTFWIVAGLVASGLTLLAVMGVAAAVWYLTTQR